MVPPKNSDNQEPQNSSSQPFSHSLQKINNQLFIMGSVHISEQSAQQVSHFIQKLEPDCIMLELDLYRANLLKSASKNFENGKDMEEFNLGEKDNLPKEDSHEIIHDQPSKLFTYLQNVQNMVGQLMGIQPGQEMLMALQIVRNMDIRLKYIDQPIHKTLARLQSAMMEDNHEEVHLMQELTTESFIDKPTEVSNIIEEFHDPQMVAEALQIFTKEYPQLAEILLKERNTYMIRQIMDYYIENSTDIVLIIVGAGHVDAIKKGLITELQNWKNEIKGSEDTKINKDL